MKTAITENEYEIVLRVRQLKPYEKIEIIADQWGRIDHYLIHAQEKKVLKKSKKIEIEVIHI